MSVYHHFVSCAALLLVLVACSPSEPEPGIDPARASYVVAVNSPLAYFASRLLDGASAVLMPVPAGIDPATWRPGVEDIQLLQGAELVLLNGAGYSSWLTRVSLSDSRTVVSSEAVRDRWIPLAKQVTHSHGPAGEHAHGALAFTTWMDMTMARLQAAAVAAALKQRFPQQSSDIANREQTLLAELDALDEAYTRVSAQLSDRQIIYSHPVYQYFEARYGLPGLSLHWEPDAMPTDAQWQSLTNQLEDNSLFVWESEPDAAVAARLAELGVQQVTLAPGGNIGDADWLALQRSNLETLAALVSAP